MLRTDIKKCCMQCRRLKTSEKQAEAFDERAFHYLNLALAIHCDRPQLYLQRGLAYWRKGDIEAMVRPHRFPDLEMMHIAKQCAAMP